MADGQLLVAILAGGASRRLGRPKQLVSIDGEPLLRRQCRLALDAHLGPVVAVLGCRADACAAAIADLPVAIRVNPEWAEGMAASVRAAVETARDRGAAAVLLVLCDQYRLTPPDLRALHAAWRGSPGSACVSRAGSYAGPPAILPAARFERALELRGDRGARAILHAPELPPPREVRNPRARFDLDDRGHLERLRGSARGDVARVPLRPR